MHILQEKSFRLKSARAIIPTTIIQILEGKKSISLGNLHPTRDLTYVKDTVRGFIEIAKNSDMTGEVVNIGTNSEISIGDLVTKISELMQSGIRVEVDQDRVRTAKSEVDRLFCDNTKITSMTGWKPEYTLEKGLTETIEYIRENINDYKSEIYNI